MAGIPDVALKIGVDDKEALNRVAEFEKKAQAKLQDALKTKISTSVDQSEFDKFATKLKSSVKDLSDGAKVNLSIKVDDAGEIPKLKEKVEQLKKETGSDINVRFNVKQDQNVFNQIKSEVKNLNDTPISIKAFLGGTIGKELEAIKDSVGGIQKLTATGFVLKFSQVGLDGIVSLVKGIGENLLGGGIDLVSGIEGNQIALEQALFNKNKKGGQDAGLARVNASNQSQTIADAILQFSQETPFTSSNIFGLATILQNRGFDTLAGTNNGQNRITSTGNNNILNVASDLISRQVLLGKTQDEATADFARAISEFKSGQFTSLKTRFDIGNADIGQAVLDAGLGKKVGISKSTDDFKGEDLQGLSPEEVVKVFGKISENLGAGGLSGQQSLSFKGLLSTLQDGADALTRAFFGSAKDSESLFSQLKGAIKKAIAFLDSPEGKEFKSQLGDIGKSIGRFIEEALSPGNIKAFGEGLVAFGDAVKQIFSPENIQNAVSFFQTVGEKFQEGGLLSVFTTSGDEYSSKSVAKSIDRTSGKVGDLKNQLALETDPQKRKALEENIRREENTLAKLQEQQKTVDAEANKPLTEKIGGLLSSADKGLDSLTGGIFSGLFGKDRGTDMLKQGQGALNKFYGLDENLSGSEATKSAFGKVGDFKNGVQNTVSTLWSGDFKGQAGTFGQAEDSPFASIIIGIGKARVMATEWLQSLPMQITEGWARFGDIFTKDIPNFIKQGSDTVSKFFIQDIPNFLETTKNNIIQWFNDRIMDATNFANQIKTNVTDFINQDWQKILEDMAYNAGAWIRDRITDFITFKDDTIKSFEEFRNSGIAKILEVSENIKQFALVDAPTFIANIPVVLESKFNEGKDFAIGKLDELKNYANDRFNDIKNYINGVPQQTEIKFNEAKDLGNNKIKELSNYAGDRFNDIKGYIAGIPGEVEKKFNEAKDFGKNKLDELKNYAGDRFNDIKNFASDIGTSIENAFTNAKNSVVKTFEDIKKGFEDLKNSVGNIADSFVKGLKGESRATGGGVKAGTNYTVAEKGRELYRSDDGIWKMLTSPNSKFTPQQNGFIFPNQITEQIMARIQPQPMNTNNNYNFNNQFQIPSTSDSLQGYYAGNKLLSSMDKELRGQLI